MESKNWKYSWILWEVGIIDWEVFRNQDCHSLSSLSHPRLACLSFHSVFHFYFFWDLCFLPWSGSLCVLTHTVPKLPALRVYMTLQFQWLPLIITVLLSQFKLRGSNWLSLGQGSSPCPISFEKCDGTMTTKYITYFCRVYESSTAKKQSVGWAPSHPS